MDIYVASEKAARLAEGDMRLQRLVEEFIGYGVQMVRYMHAKRIRKIDLFA
jgi:hypothetical protein